MIDVYWSFRSPYSWLAADRLAAIEARYGVKMAMRFVRPLALREDGFFKRNRPQWLPYLLKDVFREGQRLGVPVASPRPDPIVMDFNTGEVAKDQPYIHRLMDLGLAAELSAGRGLDLARALARPVWTGVEDWHQGEVLANAGAEAGFDVKALQAWADANRGTVDATIRRNEAAQMAHHWGVPLMVLNDEPFFGQDRLDSLEWRLQQAGDGQRQSQQQQGQQ
ncbi:MAG: 2-hydroxychromene-2-carboxylate isomerase [Alphaproteobacteria bacterium]|nr:2-hydroxychromene-2-carboxylate isomerase [Alphaproteobacteria bacterium]